MQRPACSLPGVRWQSRPCRVSPRLFLPSFLSFFLFLLSSPPPAQNIGKAVYKDKDQIIEQLRKAYPPFKEAKEFEFAFKIR